LDKSLKKIKDEINKTNFIESSQDKAMILISCSGRKEVLGEEYNKECENVFKFDKEKKSSSNKFLAGFSSFGEFIPIVDEKGNRKNIFNNMTMVLAILTGGK
jgi:hypothetical protein